ncbi:carbamoyltransferase [bacterium]|nr:carbamoyltransferase [bacterium]
MDRTELILGIYPGHNCNVSLVTGRGEILFAMEEARFSRVKDQAGIPHRALEYIRQRFGDHYHCVTVRDSKLKRPLRDIELTFRSLAKGLAPPSWTYLWRGYLQTLKRGRVVETGSRQHAPWLMKAQTSLENISHHSAHAASAYYCSGFEAGPVMTLDGQGDDRYSCTFSWGRGARLETLNNLFFNEAPFGYNFQIVTAMLGFHGGRHPGKITGLASYEERNEACRHKLEQFLDGLWKRKSPNDALNYASFLLFNRTGQQQLRQEREKSFGEYSLREMAIAVQDITVTRTLALIRKNLGPGPYPSLALAGGVFANVKLNQQIKEAGVQNIFIQPAMGDEGLSLGAALSSAARRGTGYPRPLETVFLGPEFSLATMQAAIQTAGLKYEQPESIEEKVAELLADGKVIARYDGRIEYGPRALGNRSILYHTQDKTVNDWLNKRLNRTEFMPFAPVTLYEYADQCYEQLEGAWNAARFMTITFPCTPWMKRTSPAVVHVDGTARPQILRECDNPGYYRMLDHYRRLTGIPSLINTSFNMHEEPIVCTPDDAIRAFVQSQLDYLALGPFLVYPRS